MELLIGATIIAVTSLTTHVSTTASIVGGTTSTSTNDERETDTDDDTDDDTTNLTNNNDNHPTTFYHGSDHKIAILEPRQSPLTQQPVVFATPNYDDAVVFAGMWTDYNFAFGGWDNKKYLDEKYPNAFTKLDRVGYIHVFNDPQRNFKPLGSGMQGEYVSTKPAIPDRVDEVNVLQYTRTKSSIVMRTYERVIQDTLADSADDGVLTNVLCHILILDVPSDDIVRDLLRSNNYNVIHQWDWNRKNPSRPSVLIGTHYAHVKCPKYILKLNIDDLASKFKSGKTTTDEYKQYLTYQHAAMMKLGYGEIELDDVLTLAPLSLTRRSLTITQHSL